MADYTNDPITNRAANAAVVDPIETREDGVDGIQHGLDDSPTGDATKGAVLGGVGGAIVGALAGGPIGAVIGALAGGAMSGAAVAAVDTVDNDDNVTGVGSEVAYDNSERGVYANSNLGTTSAYDVNNPNYREGYRYDETTGRYIDPTTGRFIDPDSGRFVDAAGNFVDPATNYDTDPALVTNGVPGIQTGGYAVDGTPDTRGIYEKTADTLTGDHIDDKTGSVVSNPGAGYGNTVSTPTYGNNQPGVQTGGRTADGSADTRGILEKTADAVTGDNTDDKTGKRVS